MNNRIAVIMSLYRNDTLPFVSLSIQSVLNQTIESFDLYLQYDGPIRHDVEVFVNSIDDARVFVNKRADNRGLAQSLNDLLAIVIPKGYEYIARMDADDICHPDRFRKQLLYLQEHPDVDCVGTWAIEIDSSGKEFFRKQMPETHQGCLNLFRKRDCMIHPTVMFRKSYFEKAGLYATDTYFGEDTMMWAQGFKEGCVFANIPEYLYYFRLDDHFFERRRGWKHACGILSLRKRVNKMLGFGLKEHFYALSYALAKLMPRSILNLLYKIAR